MDTSQLPLPNASAKHWCWTCQNYVTHPPTRYDQGSVAALVEQITNWVDQPTLERAMDRTSKLPPISAKDKDRLWAGAHFRGPDECWEWRKARTTHGYGLFHIGRRRVSAHRVAFVVAGGVIPPGYDIDHLCRNRICINPRHLEAVTRAENLRRSPITLTGINSRKTMCPLGHELSGANLLVSVTARGTRRSCRACDQIQSQGVCPKCGKFRKWLRSHLRSGACRGN